MVALAILALALTVISQSQSASMRQVLRAKMMTTAVLLARHKMVDIEDDLFKEGFSDFEETEKGDFEDQDFGHFKWELKIEKIELPESVDADAVSDAAASAGAPGGGAGSLASGTARAGGAVMGAQFQLIRPLLESSIRRVLLKVHWKEGTAERSITVTSYFTDTRKVTSLGGLGSFAAPSAKGGPGTGNSTSGNTGNSTNNQNSQNNPSLPGFTR
jgi:hypothetical protein